MTHDVHRAAGRHRRFLRGHPAEVVHLDELGDRRVLGFERLERPVQIEQLRLLAVVLARYRDVRVPRDPGLAAAALGRPVGPRVVDQDLPHHARHERKKMRAVRELWLGVLEEFDEGFVDQRCRLQGVTGPLVPHERPCDPPQLAVDERHQLIKCALFSRAKPLEQAGDLMGGHFGTVHVSRSYVELSHLLSAPRHNQLGWRL
jgi:hypothetical protein